jgi:hypothetical protein
MNKYRNKWTQCKQGHNHQSSKEASYCNNLKLLLKAREIISYDSQYKFELFADDNEFICYHIVDFLVRTKNFNDEIHEVKSNFFLISHSRYGKQYFDILL